MAFFDHYISYQRDDGRSPYNDAVLAVHFMPRKKTEAILVGAHDIRDQWRFADRPDRLPNLFHPANLWDEERRSMRVYDLVRRPELEDLVGRVVIDWGRSTRSWSQWAGRGKTGKPIVEIRAAAAEEAFPGFARFRTTVENIPVLPPSWQGALGSVGGVYLLVCPRTGEQYVGSATGEGGFLARWSAYVADGHGGNLMLKMRDRENYAVSILEVASPDMAARDVIEREGAWKTKLGSRAHGLNAN